MEHESIWRKTSAISERGTLLEGRKADVAVIGGGMCGILCAHHLQQQGKKVIVLEAGTIGGGVTQNTTAKITCQHGLIYDKLIQSVGTARAQQYATLNGLAVEAYANLISNKNIDCDFSWESAYVYSLTQEEMIEREVFAARTLGIPARFSRDTGLPFPIKAAVQFEHQAQFHPLKFMKALAQELEIYEHTPVLSLEGNRLATPRGSVRADAVIVATHYPFLRWPGLYFMRMHQARSYVIALERAGNVNGMYIDEKDSGYTLRNYKEYLLLGGGGHRTGEPPKQDPYADLRARAMQWYPQSQVVAQWSAQDCMTLDGMPYIGQLSPAMPHVYVATGFNKWGMTSSMAAALLLGEQIAGRKHPCEDAFSPRRLTLSASVKPFLIHAGKSLKNIALAVAHIPGDRLENIQPGQSGEVVMNGRRMGVYRDSEGQVHAVTLVCPHLGCKLTFNPVEKTWDCPCHGSRFTYQGELLEDPAQSGIQRSDE